MIGKAIALYALWQAWRGRKAWRLREPSLLELQDELNALRFGRREAALRVFEENYLGIVGAQFVDMERKTWGDWQIQPLRAREIWL